METKKHLIVVAFIKESHGSGYQVLLVSGPRKGAQALVAGVYQDGAFTTDLPGIAPSPTIRVRHPRVFLLHGWLEQQVPIADRQDP